MNKTASIKAFFTGILTKLPKPYSKHIIDEVFHAIEMNHAWMREYESLCAQKGKSVVNSMGAFWIASALEKAASKQVPSTKSTLINAYSILETNEKASKKVKEPEALQMMSDYYRANKDKLHAGVKSHREEIVEMIMAGMTPEQAFMAAEEKF
jgi:hypothetical protein